MYNTFYNHPARRLYTWISSTDILERIIRKQTKTILIKKKYKNCIKSAKLYDGADVNSDHNPVVANIKLKKHPAIIKTIPEIIKLY